MREGDGVVDGVRRSFSRTGGRRWAAGLSLGVATALAVATTSGLATAQVPPARAAHQARTAALPALGDAEQAFGLSLLARTTAAEPTGDVTVSPLSLADALAMLENGAAGTTLEQIAATLDTSALTPAEQDAAWSAMTSSLTASARRGGISLDSANGLWLQAGFPLRAAFTEAIRRFFGAGVSSADFAHDLAGALAAINAWVSLHTAGKITRLFGPGQVSSATRLVLASAVYFHAAWEDPFDPSRTVPGPFFLPARSGTAGATSAQVELMTGTVSGAAATTSYDVALLPYRGGSDEAVVVMPLHESLPAFIDTLDPARLGAIVSSAPAPGLIELPRFTTTSDLDLVPTLTAMGMPDAFSATADLSSLSPTPTSVQSVVQRDYLKVAEAGTEAAAATGIAVAPTAVAPTTRAIVFDHPFVFLIRNVTTGALLFASAVENPSPSAAAP
ncbi:MAG TPA: serpin family protein [Acidimicrobiales bacterium]|nr:serpin family protein [Acidimicrobiales bacterium]